MTLTDHQESRELVADQELEEARQEFRDFFGVDPLPNEDAAKLRRRIKAAQEQSTNEAPADDDPTTPPGLMGGGQTIRVTMGTSDPEDDRWYQVYEFPPGSGQFVSYQFNSIEQLGAATGERFPSYAVRSENWFTQNVMAEAPAEEIIGRQGNFQGLMREVMRDAAEAAGVRDPTLVGRIASDPEMQRIMAQSVTGEWTPEQVRAAQRQTSFWKNELYPGIEKFYNKTAEPERAWAEYRKSVAPALRQLGYEPGADGTYKDQIGRMLNQEIDAQAFVQQVPTFVRAQQNVEFAGVLNRWAERELGREVEFNDWFDLMAGEAIPEIEAVAERAQLAYRAQEASAGLGVGQIERLAERTDLSDAEAQRLFSDFGRGLLALGETGLQRGGLNRDEVLSALAGVDPGTGRSIEEVKLQMAKVARENDLFDEEKLNFFVGFSQRGTPQRPGLQPIAPEGA